MPVTQDFIDPSWDPMKDDYEDQQFNSYVEGQGKRLKDQKEFCIRVQNIPPQLSRNAIFNIFSKYGEVKVLYKNLSKFSNEGLHVAYLAYDSQISANRAIEGVHKEPTYNFKVNIAPTIEEKNRNDQIVFDNRFVQNAEVPERNGPEPDNIYEGPKFEEIQSHFFPSDAPHFYIAKDNFDPTFCNPFFEFQASKYKIYPILDKMSSKLVETANKRVSLGHGYYVAENQNSNTAVKQNSFRLNEKLKIPKSERCIVCDKPAFTSCSACSLFYCGRRCQNLDWQQHKSLCADQTQRKNSCTSLISLKVTNVGSGFIYAIKADHLERFKALQKRMQEESSQLRRYTRPVKGSRCAVFIEDRNEWCRGVFVEISPPAHLIFLIDYGSFERCLTTSIRFLHPELSEEEPFALKLSLTGQNGYTVSPGTLLKVSSLEMEKDFYKAVFKECELSQSKSICSSLRSSRKTDFFGRMQVKIIDLSSEEFTEVCVKAKLGPRTYFVSWKDPIALGKCEDMSAYIAIDDDCIAILPVGANIRVRSVNRLASDFFCVETDADLIQLQNGLDTNDIPNSIINWLEKNDSGKLHIYSFKRGTSFLAILSVERNKNVEFLIDAGNYVMHRLSEKCEKLPQEADFAPKIGDYVAVKIESINVWARSIVWSVSRSDFVRCILIDFGAVVSVPLKFVRPLEKSKFKSGPSLAVHCKVDGGNSEKIWENSANTSEKIFDFIVREKSLSRVTCALMNEEKEEICLLEISEWDPTVEEVGLKAVELKSKMEVKLTQFYSSSLLYVTPVNHANFMIDQKLAKLVRSTQPLKEREPRFGELVACKWSKNNQYYRAQILELIENDRYRIFFVDSGTQEIGNMSDVFALDDELKSYPCLAVKICLKGIDQTDILGHVAVNYLNSLGMKEEPLKILLDNNDLSSVELLHLNNDIVNEKLNQYLKPEELDPYEGLYDESIEYAKLEIGAETELGLLRKANGVLYMFEPKSDAAQFVFGVLHKLINEYCENLENNGYNPYDGEVVFAQINTRDAAKRCWCRAVVTKTMHLGSHVVQCLDFGGHADILTSSLRKMHPKFMVVPALAVCVRPVVLVDLSPSEKTKIQSLFSPLETYLCKVLAKDDFEYCVDMKFINEILRPF